MPLLYHKTCYDGLMENGWNPWTIWDKQGLDMAIPEPSKSFMERPIPERIGYLIGYLGGLLLVGFLLSLIFRKRNA